MLRGDLSSFGDGIADLFGGQDTDEALAAARVIADLILMGHKVLKKQYFEKK